jgi:hypothetical protein
MQQQICCQPLALLVLLLVLQLTKQNAAFAMDLSSLVEDQISGESTLTTEGNAVQVIPES